MDPVYLTEEHNILRETARRFIAEEVQPHGDAWEDAEEIPRSVFARMGELGFFGVQAPEAYGGTDMGPVAMVAQWEELGKSSFGGFTGSTSAHAEMAVPHLINAGTDEQKRRLLPDLIAGRKVSSIAVTEPDGGSDVAALKTRAERKGNDRWVLNGAKVFITNGCLADVHFVAARTDPHAKGSRGISMFIVEKGAPGFKVAKKLDKHGWRCSDTAELVFDDCEIPYENILGEENKGFYAVMLNFQNERLVAGAMNAGSIQSALDITTQYVKDRKAFGGTLWDKQVVRHKLATLATRAEAFRHLTYHCAWLVSEGRDCVKEVSMLKAMGGELVNRTMYDCVQLHGGMGYMRESPIERMSRDARVASIGGGATEVMLEEVAKRM
ncbi:MAG: acyl-CoA dehydrogenase family protein [Rhodospirillaceae bacterium]|nr:acyl-CoA dehydrogenase family protein [Rhodospirillaceae bacterium]